MFENKKEAWLFFGVIFFMGLILLVLPSPAPRNVDTQHLPTNTVEEIGKQLKKASDDKTKFDDKLSKLVNKAARR